MMFLYLDSSALVKRYVDEPHSEEVAHLMDETLAIGTSAISRVEVGAAQAADGGDRDRDGQIVRPPRPSRLCFRLNPGVAGAGGSGPAGGPRPRPPLRTAASPGAGRTRVGSLSAKSATSCRRSRECP